MRNGGNARGVAERALASERAAVALPQLETITDAVLDLLYVVNNDGNLVWWNRRLEVVTGLSREQLHERPALEFFSEQERPSVADAIARVFKSGQAEGEWHLITASGPLPYHFNGVALKDDDGNVTGLAGIGRDISDRRRSEQAGRHWAELSQSFLNTMSDLGQGVAILQDGRFVYVNDALSQITGYTRDELLALPSFVALLAPEARIVAEDRILERRNGADVPDHTDVVGLHKDGRRIHAELSFKPISLGGRTQYFAIIRDVTERKHVERAVHRESAFVKLLQSIAVVANGAESVEEALQFAVDRICAHTGWPVGHVFLRDEDGRGFSSSGIWSAESSAVFQDFREATDTTPFGPGAGLPAWVAATAKPAWIADLRRQRGFIRAKLVDQAGLKSGFACPVLVGREIAAVLEFYSTEAEQPDEQLLEVMAHVGTQLGRVIERKRAEQQLLRSEDRYRCLVEASPEAIAVYAGEGRIVLVNAAAAGLMGADSPDQLIGKTVWDFIHPDFRDAIHERGRLSEEGETLPPAELRFVRLDGEEVVVESIARRITFEGHPAVQVSARDITERSRIQAQLQVSQSQGLPRLEQILERQLRDLERARQDLEQFAYVASHDLQEPLRMVSSYLQLLERRYKGRLDEDADDFIHFAVDGARRMQNLISDLLAYSRIGSRGRSFEPTDFNEVLDRAVAAVKEPLEAARATLTRDTLPTLIADGSQVEQLFQNLLGNAVKFRNGRRPQIHVGAQERGGEWVFSVRDNGIGIDPQYAERIFIIFQRLHARDEYPGTGMGLAICKRIVERRGGRIWVESEPGKGATFYFTMPQRGENRIDSSG